MDRNGFRAQEKKSGSCNKGQTTIEFALTLILVFGLGFFVFQISMVFAVGSYIQYATFMSARALLSSGGQGTNKEDQIQRASKVLQKTVKKGSDDRWPGLAKGSQAGGSGGEVQGAIIGPGPSFREGERGLSWQEGVRYTFRSRVFLIPVGRSTNLSSIELKSESWLGRDPTDEECMNLMKRDSPGDRGVILDNGC